jgi:hypothetical protein
MSSERDPLLHNPDAPQLQKITENKPIHPYYVVVVSFLAKLCFFISTTTQVDILLELVFRLYWNSHDEAQSPFIEDKCAHPSVRQYFTILNTLVGSWRAWAVCFSLPTPGR